MGTDGSSSSTMPVLVGAKRAMRTVAEHHRSVVGFLLGFFAVLLLYTTVFSQFGSRTAIGNYKKQGSVGNADTGKKVEEGQIQRDVQNNQTEAKLGTTAEDGGQRVNEASDRMEEEELIRQEIDQDASKNDPSTEPGAPRKPICDLSDPRFDICEISGDARTIGANRTHLEYINNVTVKSLNNASQAALAPSCTSRHAVPAVVFAMNGLTSNPWHDFSDVLIPLFITTRGYDGEVQFLVSDLQPWFVDKYRLILSNLSRYEIVDFNRDAGVVRCYPHVTVGLRSHRDLGIDPVRAPGNYTLQDFRLYVREVYSLPAPGIDIPYKDDATRNNTALKQRERKKPRVMLINRGRTRKFVNFPEIVAAVRDAGFEVIPMEPRRDLGIEEFSRVVDSCDVLMGAHGAGLTNFFFLRTNAVMLQVVPWGHMEQSAMRFYGRPATEMRLRDVEYSVVAKESTLYEKYGKDHPTVSDPDSIHRQGWQLGMRYYWIEQDIRLNVTRFAPTLQQVLRMVKE
ncbi:hypothetical protein PR202_gb17047 [Eleusine coracana subsp. coracana]|uniref:Glycosyltransferase 61 catalytic domain-containing protein n=1 Tax=Eleusine coracana subsp. coracana TaxID=191504 RepID=A0AAV5F3H5_ELECO|nr:hypothetical protein PR202_gb17047 [Eleusine coracana subsp. coracana]